MSADLLETIGVRLHEHFPDQIFPMSPAPLVNDHSGNCRFDFSLLAKRGYIGLHFDVEKNQIGVRFAESRADLCDFKDEHGLAFPLSELDEHAVMGQVLTFVQEKMPARKRGVFARLRFG